MSTHYLEFLTILLGLLLLVAEAFFPPRDKRLLAWGAASGLLLILLALPFTVTDSLPPTVAAVYTADSAALFFKGIALLTTALVLLMAASSQSYLVRGINGDEPGANGGLAEFYCLPVFACAGLMWMASAIDMVFLFVALELVTITFYVLVASMRRVVGSIEAGVKYLILGALSTGILVYGITWIFGATGTTNISAMATAVAGRGPNEPALLFGVLLVIAALAFKVGVVPFHVWIPDVYQGAPTPVTAFLSVGSKAAGVLVLVRFLSPFLDNDHLSAKLVPLLVVLTGATLLIGNLGALGQNNFKRMLAYSSIGHAGFILLGVQAQDLKGVGFYVAAYLLMTLLAFFVLALVRGETGGEEFSHFDGLSKRSPFAAFALLIAMASLAGVPLTAGFLGKFRMFFDAIEGKQWMLVCTATIGACAGFYYYFRVIKHMYWHEPADSRTFGFSPVPKLIAMVLVAAILFLGVFPRRVAVLLTPDPLPGQAAVATAPAN